MNTYQSYQPSTTEFLGGAVDDSYAEFYESTYNIHSLQVFDSSKIYKKDNEDVPSDDDRSVMNESVQREDVIDTDHSNTSVA